MGGAPATCSTRGVASFRAPDRSADRWGAGAHRGSTRVNPLVKWRAAATLEYLARRASGRRPRPRLGSQGLCGRFEEDAQGTDNQEEKRISNEHKGHEEQSDGKKLKDQTEAPTLFMRNYETL
ncbi:hypothetical protein ZWY2020_055531 [Hordeum vulgare]|nr:hypothetical protein ZWY2020_055531 [Hordeum vulgare]